jgi:hypothetical protein
MKYLLFGDIHSERLTQLDRIIQSENPQVILCTGDIDSISTIHELRDIELKFISLGKQFIKVCGNHEYSIYHDDVDLSSEELDILGKSSEELHKELMNDPVARQYIAETVNTKENILGRNFFIDSNKYGKRYPTILVHGALKGNLSSYPDCPIEIRNIWARLENTIDYVKNFDAMKAEGLRIMIRGNDHVQTYAYMNENDKKSVITRKIPKLNEKYRLARNYMHVIEPGSITQKMCAVIETGLSGETEPILKYIRF